MSSTKLIAVLMFAPALWAMSGELRQPEAFVMAVALALLPITSYFLGLAAVRRLKCTREVPLYASEDEPVKVAVHAQGSSSMLGPIDVEDILPQWIKRSPEGDIVKRSADEIAVTYIGTASKRGEYSLGPLRLRISDMLGFFRYTTTHSIRSRLVILPKPLQIPDLRLQPVGGSGDYQMDGSGTRGSGIEFHGVREYRPGDELRRVHWRSTAKHGTLNVVEYEHSRAEDVVLALDVMRGSEIGAGRFTSLEYAVKIAAGVVEQSLSLGSAASLLIYPGLQGSAAELGQGPSQLYAILEGLAMVRADHEISLPSLLIRNSELIPTATTVVCIGSSIDDELRRCAEVLASKGKGMHFILIVFPDKLPSNLDRSASLLVSAGISLTVVECLETEAQGRIIREYAA